MLFLKDAIKDVPYSTDWWEMRCTVAKLVQVVIWSEDTSVYKQYRTNIGDEQDFLYFVLFKNGDDFYLWMDAYKEGKCEVSQLELVVNKYLSKVLYAPNIGSSPVGAMFFKMRDDGIAKEICIDYGIK